MIGVLYEALGLILMFLLLGIIWGTIDSKVGVPIYRWCYRVTHKNPLPEGVKRGTIIGQKARWKLTMSYVISTIQSAYVLWHASNPNFLTELILWFFEGGAMMFGFYLVGPVARLKDVLLNRVASNLDRVEAGEATIGDLAGEVAGQAANSVAESAEAVAKHAATRLGEVVEVGIGRVRGAVNPNHDEENIDELEEPPEEEPKESEPLLEPEPEVDHRSRIDRFLNRGD